MSMSKKDYIKFAQMIADHKINLWQDIKTQACLDSIQAELCILFKRDNPNFSKSRFNDFIEKLVNERIQNAKTIQS